MLKNLGPYLTIYYDTNTNKLVFSNHEYEFFVEPELINKIVPVTWNKKAGEKFEDVAKKRTTRELIHQKNPGVALQKPRTKIE